MQGSSTLQADTQTDRHTNRQKSATNSFPEHTISRLEKSRTKKTNKQTLFLLIFSYLRNPERPFTLRNRKTYLDSTLTTTNNDSELYDLSLEMYHNNCFSSTLPNLMTMEKKWCFTIVKVKIVNELSH